MKNKLILLSVATTILLSSCVVSKRKYEEMAFAKRRSDAKLSALGKENDRNKKSLSDLRSRLDKTLADYNEMKNSMAESNAKKNTEIDELSSELQGLASDTTSLKTRLEETIERYNNLMRENKGNEITIDNLKREIKKLNNEKYRLSTKIKSSDAEMQWGKKKLAEQKKKTATLLAEKDRKIAELIDAINKRDGKLGWLRKVKVKNEAEIERLNNQVKLYKKEYEKAIAK